MSFSLLDDPGEGLPEKPARHKLMADFYAELQKGRQQRLAESQAQTEATQAQSIRASKLEQ